MVKRLLRRAPTWLGVSLLLLLGGRPAQAQTAYFNNFDSSAVTAPGVIGTIGGGGSAQGVQGYGGLGGGPSGSFGGSFWRNSTTGFPPPATVVTLSNLPSHTSVSVQALLAIIDSWDGPGASPGPDSFWIELDGVTRFSEFFGNQSGGLGQTYNTGVLGTPQRQQRGFNTSWLDAAYDLGANAGLQNIAHSSSTLTLRFFANGPGWQGGNDESWAMDNLRITLNSAGATVPEPASLLLMGPGLALLGFLKRRWKDGTAETA